MTMAFERLIEEGRKLQRACNLLKPDAAGEPVAMWFEPDPDDESITDWHRWMTVRADAIPNAKAPPTVYFSLYTKGLERGLIDFVDGWPPRNGTPLYAHPASVLPPIEVVFALGSAEIEEWLKTNGWKRDQRYDGNFPDAAVVDRYQQVWFSEHPVFRNDPRIYAFTGGWHLPSQDSDWHDLIPAKLLVTTVRDSEPCGHAPSDAAFITTDAPFVISPPPDWPFRDIPGRGILVRGSTKAIALSQRLCLSMGDPGGFFGHLDLQSDGVRKNNLAFASRTERFVISPNEALLRDIVSFLGWEKSE